MKKMFITLLSFILLFSSFLTFNLAYKHSSLAEKNDSQIGTDYTDNQSVGHRRTETISSSEAESSEGISLSDIDKRIRDSFNELGEEFFRKQIVQLQNYNSEVKQDICLLSSKIERYFCSAMITLTTLTILSIILWNYSTKFSCNEILVEKNATLNFTGIEDTIIKHLDDLKIKTWFEFENWILSKSFFWKAILAICISSNSLLILKLFLKPYIFFSHNFLLNNANAQENVQHDAENEQFDYLNNDQLDVQHDADYLNNDQLDVQHDADHLNNEVNLRTANNMRLFETRLFGGMMVLLMIIIMYTFSKLP